MSIIQVNKLYMSFSGETLLKDINFSVDEKDKIGIIGANGVGKTTLIRLLMGLEYSEVNPETNERGSISLKNNLKIAYLSQNSELNKENTVFNELMTVFFDVLEDYEKIQELNSMLSLGLGDFEKIMEELGEVSERYERKEGYSIEYKIKQILNGLNIAEDLWNLKIKNLSGGQNSRVALAKILLEEPELLILDEPTNHLDLNSIEWLEKILKDYNKAIILISHDVYFLDNVVNRIFEIEGKKIKDYKGNYSDFLIQKEAYLSGAVKAYEKEQEKIKKMEEFIRRYKAGVKSKQARGREKILNRMEKMENPVVTTKKIKLEFEIKSQSVDLVVNVNNISKSFKEKKLFSAINFKIFRGERIGIIGKNGSGKSTLLKIINGMEKANSGSVEIGERVSVAYYDQNHQGLGMKNNILEELMYHFTMSEEEARNMCGAFLFREDDIYKNIENLSGGERARVAFMKLILQKPNFLILDEPTNHLDIYSREILINALEKYSGTILLVSHDRNFLDSVVNKIYELKEEGVELFDGDYESYKKEQERVKEKNEEAVKNYEEQKRNRNRISVLEKKIVKFEEEIMKLENEKENLKKEYEIAGNKNDLDELLLIQEKLTEQDKKINDKYSEWEEANEELKKIKN